MDRNSALHCTEGKSADSRIKSNHRDEHDVAHDMNDDNNSASRGRARNMAAAANETSPTLTEILARMDAITCQLISNDPALEPVIENSTLEWDLFVKSPFVALVGAVVGTLVRYTQARAVRERLYAQLGGVDFGHESLASVLEDAGACRTIRLSPKHIAILRVICSRTAQMASVETADDLRRLASGIPGVGPWTTETAVVTCLLDADAFPSGDKWLRRKMALAYGMSKSPTPKEAEVMARRWSPYRAIATAYLWRWLDQTEAAQMSL